MDKARLVRERAAQGEPLTADEQAYVALKWRDLPRAQQEPFKQHGQRDKERFVAELTAFLDSEREQVARKRKYESVETSSGGAEAGVAAAASAPEPVAYVFEDRIAEPSGEGFRMQIGDARRPGKASSTLAFVLGHGTRAINGVDEPVTKVLLRPLTGRRHQLRLHLAHNGFPIVGDVTYGDEDDDAQRMLLHAWKLWLVAPPEAQVRTLAACVWRVAVADSARGVVVCCRRVLTGGAALLCAPEQYGDLFFTSPDPFEEFVPSEREITTMTYVREKLKQQQQQS
ncbi:hypothetical protein PybrP1_013214 [[Pythium] brassicae (nom. inval.)]|nr:hypothetical protein PybrP1_013214 [[Pythium] brassicae (nom. inval.)]